MGIGVAVIVLLGVGVAGPGVHGRAYRGGGSGGSGAEATGAAGAAAESEELTPRAVFTAIPASRPPIVPSSEALAGARSFAAGRRGRVSFAVIDARGRLSGLRVGAVYPSASVSKAMLLVASLRRSARAPLTPAERRVLGPMVRRSDNRAATRVHAIVGDAGLRPLARAAGMTRFSISGSWSEARVSAADQARFFRRLDRLTPPRHRAYARLLLSSIATRQSWGVPRAARPRWRVLFKGGWRPSRTGRLVHQAALLEQEGVAISVAVLTDGSPSYAYGYSTVRGVAERLLAPARHRAARRGAGRPGAINVMGAP